MDPVAPKKELVLSIEPRLPRPTIAPLVVLTAATLLLIFSAHLLIYRREKSIVLLWNLDTIGALEDTRIPAILRVNGSLGLLALNSFQISHRRGLLYEADVIVFDLENSLKYPDDVRNMPKRSGQSWILLANPSRDRQRFETADQRSLMHHLPSRMTSQIDLIISLPTLNGAK